MRVLPVIPCHNTCHMYSHPPSSSVVSVSVAPLATLLRSELVQANMTRHTCCVQLSAPLVWHDFGPPPTTTHPSHTKR